MAIAATEKLTPLLPAQTVEGPVMVPAADGNGFTDNTKVLLTPFPQALTGVTVMVPELAVVLKSEVMLLVVPDAVPPDGKDQV